VNASLLSAQLEINANHLAVLVQMLLDAIVKVQAIVFLAFVLQPLVRLIVQEV